MDDDGLGYADIGEEEDWMAAAEEPGADQDKAKKRKERPDSAKGSVTLTTSRKMEIDLYLEKLPSVLRDRVQGGDKSMQRTYFPHLAHSRGL